MNLRPPLAILTAITLTACDEFPAIEASTSQDVLYADFPELVPLDGIRDNASSPISAREAAATQAATSQTRVNALKARAARLQRTGLSDNDKADLNREISAGDEDS